MGVGIGGWVEASVSAQLRFLDQDADADEIKKAYRKAALLTHPG